MICTRTSCTCDECRSWCKRLPAYFLPPDLKAFVEKYDDHGERLLASPGTLVYSPTTGPLRLQTIVPDRGPSGACTFLDENERCTIHADAPFGCAFFACDKLQSQEEANALRAGAAIIMMDVWVDYLMEPEYVLYRNLWYTLWNSGRRRPDHLTILKGE